MFRMLMLSIILSCMSSVALAAPGVLTDTALHNTEAKEQKLYDILQASTLEQKEVLLNKYLANYNNAFKRKNKTNISTYGYMISARDDLAMINETLKDFLMGEQKLLLRQFATHLGKRIYIMGVKKASEGDNDGSICFEQTMNSCIVFIMETKDGKSRVYDSNILFIINESKLTSDEKKNLEMVVKDNYLEKLTYEKNPFFLVYMPMGGIKIDKFLMGGNDDAEKRPLRKNGVIFTYFDFAAMNTTENLEQRIETYYDFTSKSLFMLMHTYIAGNIYPKPGLPIDTNCWFNRLGEIYINDDCIDDSQWTVKMGSTRKKLYNSEILEERFESAEDVYMRR